MDCIFAPDLFVLLFFDRLSESVVRYCLKLW